MSRPTFLVIGAQRAGTTLLHTILAAHPEIYVPKARKEIHYFDRYHERGPEWYASYFPVSRTAGCQAIGEVTPGYLACREAPARIKAELPDVRLIAILRDPVARAISWYDYQRRSRNEQRPFEVFLEQDPEALDAGFYHRHLERYLGLFDRRRLHIMIYEDLVRQPGPELERLRAFLGLERSWQKPEALLARRVNASSLPRFRQAFALARRFGSWLLQHDVNWPSRAAKKLGIRRLFGASPAASSPRDVSAETRAMLAGRYRPDVERLEQLLGRSLWPSGREPGRAQALGTLERRTRRPA